MKLPTKMTALILAVTLAVLPLVGCGKKDNQQDEDTVPIPLGRYVEQPWELPGEAIYMNVMHQRPDGRIAMLVSDEEGVQRYYSVSDGSDWQEETPAWLTELNKNNTYINGIDFNSKGTGVASYYIPAEVEGERGTSKIALIQPDGTMTDTPIGDKDNPHTEEDGLLDEDGWLSIQSVFMGEDDQIYLSFRHRRMGAETGRFDPVSGKCSTKYLQGANDFLLSGDSVVQFLDKWGAQRGEQITLENDSVIFLDAATGDQQRIVSAEDLGAESWGTAFGSLADGTLYAASKTGIFRLTAGSDAWEKLLDGALCSISLPTLHTGNIIPHGDNQFLIDYSGEESQLINYVYSEETPARPEIELNVYSMTENETLSQAMGVFRKAHPEVLVNIRTTNEEDAGFTGDDARAALNTELLAGKGPDVMLLENLPMESYIEKGVLIDLTDIIKPMMDAGELLPNIVNALERDGKVYAVPTRFKMPTLWGAKEAVAAAGSLSTLADYAEANAGKPVFSTLSPDWLLFQFGRSRMNGFLGADGQVDVAYLEQFYTDVKRLSDTQVNPPAEDEGERLYNEYLWQHSWDDVRALASSKAQMVFSDLGGYDSIMEPNGAVYALLVPTAERDDQNTTVPDNEVNEVFRLKPGATPDDKVFYPASVVGINAASTQQELAAEFVLAMLSEETQSAELINDNGFPVNSKAIDLLINSERYMSMSYMSTDENGVDQVDLHVSYPSKAMLKAVTGHFDILNTPVLSSMENQYLMEMIINGSKAYFDGTMSAREAAEAVRQESRIMLAE